MRRNLGQNICMKAKIDEDGELYTSEAPKIILDLPNRKREMITSSESCGDLLYSQKNDEDFGYISNQEENPKKVPRSCMSKDVSEAKAVKYSLLWSLLILFSLLSIK